MALKIVFKSRLHLTPSGVSPDGAVFPFECLKSYDLEKGEIVLRDDFEVWIECGKDNDVFMFESPASGTTKIFVHKSLIKEIWNLENNTRLYPEQTA